MQSWPRLTRIHACSPEVSAALEACTPIVAIESTLFVHGLPRPESLDTLVHMDAVVRDAGATPAVVGVLGGKVHFGLAAEQIERLITSQAPKAGLRDVPMILHTGGDAATTVSATVFLARVSGISVCTTGGIGGVHLDAATTGDVSADLHALAANPVLIVCSGIKSVLDIPRTVELMETLNIPMVGFGTSELPAFYTRESGLPLEHRVTSPAEAAHLFQTCLDLGLSAGMLVLNPPPAEFALEKGELTHLVHLAASEARERRIRGKELTPFLLSRLRELSGGRTLQVNQALVTDNARLAARISVEMSRGLSRAKGPTCPES